jgi:hypothetical protein
MHIKKILNMFYCPSYPHVFTILSGYRHRVLIAVAARPNFFCHFVCFGTQEKMENALQDSGGTNLTLEGLISTLLIKH